ncbi:MAG: VPLPA-CTERM sorting domain-containing protein [Gammaproteobacteria bacterium]|nr:VPLPA-CTERM sorting domain-containing protein [Gammaproteobacteria bacterium]
MKVLNRRQVCHCVFATIFVFLLGTDQLRAATVNIDVSGSIIYESGIPGIILGDSFTAAGSYDDATVANTTTATYSTYSLAPSFSVSLSAGSASYNYGNVTATVWDDADLSGLIGAPYTDYYPALNAPLDMFILTGSSEATVGFLFPVEVVSIAILGTSNLYSGTDLSITGMDLLNSPELLGAFAFIINNEVDTLAIGQVSAVPVPAAVWLFVSGLIALLGVSRKR